MQCQKLRTKCLIFKTNLIMRKIENLTLEEAFDKFSTAMEIGDKLYVDADEENAMAEDGYKVYSAINSYEEVIL